MGPAKTAASSRNTASSATSPALCTQVSNWCRVVVIPSTSGASSLAKAVAFLQSHRADIDAGSERQKEMQLKQNKMMMNRILFQAVAIVIVFLLLVMNR